jgi:acid phosphatase
MNGIRLPLLALVAALALRGQANVATTYENLNALIWTQRAAEYKASTLQTFQVARYALKEALNQPTWTAALEQNPPYRDLPPAIVLDLDETVLDNSPFMAESTSKGLVYTEERWQKWVDKEQATAIPGAVEFLKYAHSQGVAAIYITNRVCDPSKPADHTVALLKRLQFPMSFAGLMCRASADESTDKSARRAKAAAIHRILLLFGDDLADFVSIPAVNGDWKTKVEARDEIMSANRENWGTRWFLLPNPEYGSWERAVGVSVKAKLDAMRQ